MNPTVSVIIPTYNRVRFITEAIDSVLTQTYANFEIIVVDDGSTDNTKDVLRNYREKINYIGQENQGVSAARNTGIRCAKGEYIAFLDSDDLWFPKKLEKQVSILNDNKEISLVYTNLSYCNEKGKFIRVVYPCKRFASGYLFEQVLLFKIACGHLLTWLIRKDCFHEVGLLNTYLKMSEDREITLRMAHRYEIHGISEPLVMVRLHDPSDRLGHSPPEVREKYYFMSYNIALCEFKGDPVMERNKNKVKAWYLFLSGRGFLSRGQITEARKRFFRSIAVNPFKWRVYLYAFGSACANILGTDLFVRLVNIRRKAVRLRGSVR